MNFDNVIIGICIKHQCTYALLPTLHLTRFGCFKIKRIFSMLSLQLIKSLYFNENDNTDVTISTLFGGLRGRVNILYKFEYK